MRFISTYMHGVLDYVVGLVLIAAPWLLGFADDGPGTWVPVAVGIGMIGMAFLTDYELGVVRVIPMSLHLTMDALVGAFLAASPWLLRYADHVWIPHVVVGIVAILTAATTRLTVGLRDNLVNRFPST